MLNLVDVFYLFLFSSSFWGQYREMDTHILSTTLRRNPNLVAVFLTTQSGFLSTAAKSGLDETGDTPFQKELVLYFVILFFLGEEHNVTSKMPSPPWIEVIGAKSTAIR